MSSFWIFLYLKAQVNDMDLEEAFHVLNDMMETFEAWFPTDESDTKEDIEIYNIKAKSPCL
jgi:hypothetical protein